MFTTLTRGEVTALVPDMDKRSEVKALPTLPVRVALPPPSNEYWASVAPSLRYLYSVIDSYKRVDWKSWDEDDRLDVMAQLQWCDEWLRWYRDEAPKLRDEFSDLLKRRNSGDLKL